MKRRMLDSGESNGSMLKGMVATFLALLVLGPFMAFGWIVAGLFGGIAARGGLRGFVTGLVGGIILALILIEVSYYITPGTINYITGFTGNFYFINHLVSIYDETRLQISIDPLHTIISVIADGAIIPAVGGLIGGLFLPRDSE